ncbi:MAG: tetratricopeptide repeat protein, partial [Candidatus Eisenbacteria bacterium]
THKTISENFFCETEYRIRLLAKTGRLSEASEAAEAMRIETERTDRAEMIRYWWAAGCVEAARGNFDSAAALFRKASGRSADRFWAQYTLARAYLDSGKLGEAVEVLEKSIKAYTSSRAFYSIWAVKAHYLLGTAYERSGWTGEAIEQYEKFLEIWKDADPGVPEVEDARLRLRRLTS